MAKRLGGSVPTGVTQQSQEALFEEKQKHIIKQLEDFKKSILEEMKKTGSIEEHPEHDISQILIDD